MTTQTIAATQAPQVAAALFEFLDETHQRLQQELAQMNRVVEAFVQDRMTAADAEQLAATKGRGL